MQTIPKTVPNTKATKKTTNALSQIEAAHVKKPFKLKPSEDYDLARLLAACCDCV